MAEVAGLVLGGVSVFKNVVDFFEYIKLGKDFGTNFQTCRLALEHDRLMLAYWGHTLGLDGSEAHNSLVFDRLKPGGSQHAERLLNQLLNVLEKARKMSQKFEDPAGISSAVSVYADGREEEKMLDEFGRLCLNATHKLTDKFTTAQLGAKKFTNKVKWALIDEKAYRQLMNDVHMVRDQLFEAFPAGVENARQLCQEQVDEIKSQADIDGVSANGSLALMKDVAAASQDKKLEETISKALPSVVGPSYNSFTTTGNSKVANQATTVMGNVSQQF